MIGALIAYPFVLIARRPGDAIGLISVSAAVFIAIDLGFAELGVDVLGDDAFTSDARLYVVLTNILSMFLVGLVMGLALEQLGQRLRKPSLRDGVALWALSIWYGVAVLLPFILVTALLAGGLSLIAPEPYREAFAAGVVCLAAVAFVYVSVRLWFAGPRTLVNERVHLFKSWPLTRGKFWPIFGLSILAAIPSVVIILAPTLFALLTPSTPLSSFQAQTPLAQLAEIALAEFSIVFGTFYFSAAQTFVFDRLGNETDA